ncbi:hypothetical protein [Flavobacterium palustre]|uniref:hypothetical protein n=1 Tax=Flavobacterium palustre TaxID=1476463 RepID=UPI0036131A93
MLRLINQLLDFRKVEDQKFTLRASNTKIYDFTNEVMTILKEKQSEEILIFS